MESNKAIRRKHGGDGCHKQIPTQKFQGYCGDNIWICNNCFKKLIKEDALLGEPVK